MITNIFTYSRAFAFLVCLMIGLSLNAQQDAQYTQFMYNTQSYNPAFVGLSGEKSVVALLRSQWMGVEGAPKTQMISYNAPTKMNNLSMGIGIVNDKIGPTSETYFDLDFSYKIALSGNSFVNFGIKASAHLLDINYNLLTQDTSLGSDPLLAQNIDNRFSPNIGAGVLYYQDDFFIGFSVPSFLETLHFDRSSLSEAREKMHFYVTSGLVVDIDQNLLLRPSLLVKAVPGAPIQMDVSATAMLKEKLSFGLSYRLQAALSLSLIHI
ncbi:MAG: type IX secretion system membrane protein PorP/SprF, partial [Flavobacteriia bacterium]|nr:type IX secretion system membrane protein PorP/SprF [Flavobacteriia bacterium]